MYRPLLVSGLAFAAWGVQPALPPTEVFVASFAVAEGRITIGEPVNVSNNPGYDNQPAFTPDGRAVLFTSVRGAKGREPANSAASGSDIYRYDTVSGTLEQVTSTPESEYSPTVMPGGSHFSVVRVEADGTQRLWRFALDGSRPELLLAGVQPVGYHAWIDAGVVALFVLGTPPSLQVVRLATGEAAVRGTNIGRSLARIPWGGVSYVQRRGADDAEAPVVMRLDPDTGESSRLVTLMPGVLDADLAWTPDGMLLTAHDGKLYGWTRGAERFTIVADLAARGLTNVSRLAVSPRGDRIAVVAHPPDPGM